MLALGTFAGTFAALLAGVSAHGLLTKPTPRNLQTFTNCENCLNGAGVCGDNLQHSFPQLRSAYLDFYNGPQATWTAGSIVAVEVKITAHHKGHYEIRICDQVIDSSVQDPEACLDKWVLERASAEEVGVMDCQAGDSRPVCQPIDARHPERFYLPSPGFYGNTHTFYVKVPAGLSCAECTLQWRWWSANSCIPAIGYGCYAEVLNSNGYDAAAWGVRGDCPGNCGGNVHCGCGEQFRNCADLTVLPAEGTTTLPSTSAVQSTTSTTTASSSSTSTTTTTTSMPSSTTTTTSMPSSTTTATSMPMTTTTTTSMLSSTTITACKSTGAEAFGGNDAKCARACDLLPAGAWPCGVGHICDCSTESSSTTTKTAAPTTPPTTTAVGRTCVPTAGLPPNGATASNCAQCAAGYQWWPCNTNPAICTCTGGSLAQLRKVRRAGDAQALEHEQ